MNRHRAVHSIGIGEELRAPDLSPFSDQSSSFVGCFAGRSAALARLTIFHIRGGVTDQAISPGGHQPPILRKLPRGGHCRELALRRQLRNAFVLVIYDLAHCGSRGLASSVACARSAVDANQGLRGENPRESWPLRVDVRPRQPNHSIGGGTPPGIGLIAPWSHVYVAR